MKLLSSIILIFGFGLWGYSLTMQPYTNFEEYNEKYLSIDREKLGREKSFQEFYSLRDEYLTNKYKLEEYGFSFLILGLFGAILFRNGWSSFRAPNSKAKTVALSILAGITTITAYMGDLCLELQRGSFPWWADSIAIPLMGVPFLAVIIIIWISIHLLGITDNYETGAIISQMSIRKLNWWFLILTVVTIAITVLYVIFGYFWFLMPCLLWLYFYLSVLAGRKAAHKTNSAERLSYY